MVSSITQDPYSIIISLNLASSVNLNIGAPPRPTELGRGVVLWMHDCGFSIRIMSGYYGYYVFVGTS